MKASLVKVKMCGMTKRADVLHAIQLGVDVLGFIFYPKSKRYITLNQAKELMSDLPPFISLVAVVVDPNPDEVWHLLECLPIHYLQFHGQESAAFCEQFGKPYLKALPATALSEILQKISLYPSASAILLDTPASTQETYGGSGQVFDWTCVPRQAAKPIVLAGGLTPDNVQQAIIHTQVYAVDVCSGIEISPGIKDHHKMAAFMRQVRMA